MGTEQPDTEGMHRLFDDVLDDADLTADVVPGVLTGYAQKVKARRYQSAGVAVAVLATAGGVAVGVLLPRGGGAGSTSTTAQQSPDYCRHQQWLSTATANVDDELAKNPAVYQASCEALQKALHTVFPDARLVPRFNARPTLDPRLDQAEVKKVDAEESTDFGQWSADSAKYFGPELKYLAIHPEDPANVYFPGQYTLITPGGRESFGISVVSGTSAPTDPVGFVGTLGSEDCARMPAALTGKLRCTPVGVAGAWHGALWNTPAAAGFNPAPQTAVLTNGQGTIIQLDGWGSDDEAWYREGTYDTGQTVPDTWINRWTGQTATGAMPPSSHALTDEQWARFVSSPALQKYADDYYGKLRAPE